MDGPTAHQGIWVCTSALCEDLRPGSLTSTTCTAQTPPSLSSTNSGVDEEDQSADVLVRTETLRAKSPGRTMDGAALAQKKHAARGCKPPAKDSASAPSSSSCQTAGMPRSLKELTPPVSSLTRKRTDRRHVENAIVEISAGAKVKVAHLSAGTLVTVSPSATTRCAGEVCTVRYVEHEFLKGRTASFLLHLEFRGETFKIPSEFVQITTSGAQMTSDSPAAISNDNTVSDEGCDVDFMESDTEDSLSK